MFIGAASDPAARCIPATGIREAWREEADSSRKLRPTLKKAELDCLLKGEYSLLS
jgi:hypothetical protein